MRAGHPESKFEILTKHFRTWYLFYLCPHNTDPLLSLSPSIYLPIFLLVYSRLLLFFFTSHTDSCPLSPLLLWSTFFSFNFFPFYTLLPSLLVFVSISFMSPFILSFFCLAQSLHLPPILLLSSLFLPCFPFPSLSFPSFPLAASPVLVFPL